MDYFINQNIHFDSINGLLKLIDNENSTVQLSRPGSRLLTELIIHCGKTMTREDLLKSVWEDHGLRPSGSNLSNHISQLRKTLSQFGIHQNIIVTVPKKGFRLEAEITLTRPSHYPDEGETDDAYSSKELHPSEVASEHVEKPEIKKTPLLFLTIVTLLIINFTLTSYSFHSKKTDEFLLNSCRAIDLSQDNGKNIKEKLNLLDSLIKKRSINCEKNKSIIYFRFTNYFPMKSYDQSSLFLTQCYQTSEKRFTHCESYLSTIIKKP